MWNFCQRQCDSSPWINGKILQSGGNNVEISTDNFLYMEARGPHMLKFSDGKRQLWETENLLQCNCILATMTVNSIGLTLFKFETIWQLTTSIRRGGAGGSGTALQPGRPQVWFPLGSLYFLLPWFFWLRCGPGVDTTSSGNAYQEYLLQGKGGRWVGLTNLPP
jgi:hypothetical protein